ncbi:hypothetical protein ACFL1H_05700 [Nanoarchaeota archaeon]
MKKSFSSKILIFLLFFQSISAIGGGLGLITGPSGSNLGFNVDMLNGIFPSFLIPGLFLLIVLGIIPFIVFLGLILKFNNNVFDKFKLYKKYHWSWNYSYYLGIILIMWINIQLLIIVESSIVHFIYSVTGVLIVILANMSSTKKDYKNK